MTIDETFETAPVLAREDPTCTYCGTHEYESMGKLSRTVYVCGHSLHKDCATQMSGCGVYGCEENKDLIARTVQYVGKIANSDDSRLVAKVMRGVVHGVGYIKDALMSETPGVIVRTVKGSLPGIVQDTMDIEHRVNNVHTSSKAHLITYTAIGAYYGGVTGAGIGALLGGVEWAVRVDNAKGNYLQGAERITYSQTLGGTQQHRSHDKHPYMGPFYVEGGSLAGGVGVLVGIPFLMATAPMTLFGLAAGVTAVAEGAKYIHRRVDGQRLLPGKEEYTLQDWALDNPAKAVTMSGAINTKLWQTLGYVLGGTYGYFAATVFATTEYALRLLCMSEREIPPTSLGAIAETAKKKLKQLAGRHTMLRLEDGT